jgi:hypothetical protein
MRFFSAANLRPFGIYLLIVVFACLPIWAVDDFVNQDGSPHLYNAYLIVELLRGNPAFTEIYALNSAPIPNLTGHYLLALFLLVFTPPVVTKIMVTADVRRISGGGRLAALSDNRARRLDDGFSRRRGFGV